MALPAPTTSVEAVDKLKAGDLSDLCDAADAAIRDGGGFGWVRPPAREVMERYWRGVLAVPLRSLFVGRLDGVIAASIQLIRQPPNNEAQAFSAHVASAFTAPWARGHGLAQSLVMAAERMAREEAIAVLQLDVRETQGAAIRLYKSLGYKHWGTNPAYARVDGRLLQGHYFAKVLTDPVGGDEKP
jgi:ribosomal protein S18 acetylase RimI-like enzyme